MSAAGSAAMAYEDALGITPERTALVHDWLTVPGGSEEVLREVLDLFPGTVFTAQFIPERFPWLAKASVKDTILSVMPFTKTRHFLYAPILPRFYARMDLSEYDLVLSDSHTFAHGVRKRPDALHVCYYHTPARSLWAPEIDDRAGRDPVRRLIARRLKRIDLRSAKGPDVVLANSQTTAKRIFRVYKREVEEVIYPPVHTQKWSDVKRESDDEGYLMWGRLIRYKRFDLAIEAAKLSGAKLNIVGTGPLEEELKDLAYKVKNVVFHGRLPDQDLKQLMARSRAVLFPGYEDFGIVPVEAMAAGLPVVAFGEGGASETVTPECGVQFARQTPGALVDGMIELERKSFDPDTLRRRAAEFDVSQFRAKYSAAVLRAWARHPSHG